MGQSVANLTAEEVSTFLKVSIPLTILTPRFNASIVDDDWHGHIFPHHHTRQTLDSTPLSSNIRHCCVPEESHRCWLPVCCVVPGGIVHQYFPVSSIYSGLPSRPAAHESLHGSSGLLLGHRDCKPGTGPHPSLSTSAYGMAVEAYHPAKDDVILRIPNRHLVSLSMMTVRVLTPIEPLLLGLSGSLRLESSKMRTSPVSICLAQRPWLKLRRHHGGRVRVESDRAICRHLCCLHGDVSTTVRTSQPVKNLDLSQQV